MTSRHPWLGAVLVVTALFFVHAWGFRFTQDDAYISLQYARNLVEGNGLVFNVGERVEGYSNFAWTMLLALLLKLGLPAIAVSRWIGVAGAAGAVLVAARYARAVEGTWGPMSVGVAALVAGSSALALWSTSGLETGLFVLLVTAALERGTAPDVSPNGRRLAPALFALATLTRPDAPLLFALWFAVRVFDTATRSGPLRDPAGVRGLALDLAIFAGPLVPWLLWKVSYYGDLLPNTYYAKAGVSSVYFARGLDEAYEYFRSYGFGGIVPALAILSIRHRRHGRRFASLLFVISGFAAYVVAIGGDVLPAFRFWLPLLPVGCLLVAAGALQVFATVRAFSRRRVEIAAMTLLIVLAITGLVLNHGSIEARRRGLQGSLDMMTSIAQWLGQRLDPSESIAATAVGAMAFFSRRPVIDMLGLTDPRIARSPERIEGLDDTWKEKRYNAASVLRRRPGAIVFSTGVRPSSTSEKALFLYEDFCFGWFPLYFRPDPRVVPTTTVYRLRPDAPPPPDTLVPAPQRDYLDDYTEGLLLQSANRDLAGAARAFERAARGAPDFFIPALEWWATTLYDLGEDRAVPMLERTVRLDRYALRAKSRLAHRRVLEGRLDEAERLAREALEVNPEDAELWGGLAEIARRRGNWEEGLEYAGRSLSLWSTNRSGLSVFASLALSTGRYNAAESAFRRMLKIDPGSEAARRGLETVARARTARPEEAE